MHSSLNEHLYEINYWRKSAKWLTSGGNFLTNEIGKTNVYVLAVSGGYTHMVKMVMTTTFLDGRIFGRSTEFA
jgi:hypothetical protein